MGLDPRRGETTEDKPGSGKGGQVDGAQGGQNGTVNNASGSTGETALITEVTSLLRSLRAPQLRAVYVKKVDATNDGSYLLDGGATNCLRTVKNETEWQQGTPVEVNSTMGTVKLRQLPCGTLVTREATQAIIPLNDLTKIGVKVVWSEGFCQMTQPGQRLKVYMDPYSGVSKMLKMFGITTCIWLIHYTKSPKDRRNWGTYFFHLIRPCNIFPRSGSSRSPPKRTPLRN